MIQILIEMLQAYEDKLTSTMKNGSGHVLLARLIMENYQNDKATKRATLKKLRDNASDGGFLANVSFICIAVVLSDAKIWGK